MDSFIANNRASNTAKKTKSDLNTWYSWCKSVKEFKKVEDIPINELDSFHFFIKVRKVRAGKDGDCEYDPRCLSDFQKSIDRQLAQDGRFNGLYFKSYKELAPPSLIFSQQV